MRGRWWWRGCVCVGGGLVVMEGTLHEKNKTHAHTHKGQNTDSPSSYNSLTFSMSTWFARTLCEIALDECDFSEKQKEKKKNISALFAVLTAFLDGSSFCVVSFPVYFPLVTLWWQFKLPPRRKIRAKKSLKFQNIRGHYWKAPKTTECLKGKLGVTLAEECY